jgi:hypothetical protein
MLSDLDGYNHEAALVIILRTAIQTYTSTGILTRCPSLTHKLPQLRTD